MTDHPQTHSLDERGPYRVGDTSFENGDAVQVVGDDTPYIYIGPVPDTALVVVARPDNRHEAWIVPRGGLRRRNISLEEIIADVGKEMRSGHPLINPGSPTVRAIAEAIRNDPRWSE